MKFTQDKKTNVAVCNGCDARCKLGYGSDAKTIQTTDLIYRREEIYPTIGGEKIEYYYNVMGAREQAVTVLVDDKIQGTDMAVVGVMKDLMCSEKVRLADEISRFCDHYKTR